MGSLPSSSWPSGPTSIGLLTPMAISGDGRSVRASACCRAVSVLRGAVFAAALAVLAGCGGGGGHVTLKSPSSTGESSATTAAGDALPGWVGSDGSLAMYLTWTENSGSLSGQLTTAEIVDGDVRSSSAGFTGTRQGSSVTLSFSRGGIAFSGQVGGSTLTLGFPNNDGTVRTLTLTHGSSSTYNAAVAQMRTNVVAAQTERQRQQQAAADAASHAKAVSALNADIASLQRWVAQDHSKLFANAWAAYSRSLQRQRDADAKVAQLVSAGASCGDIESAIGDAESARGDVMSAHGDYESADGDAQGAIASGQRYRDHVLSDLQSVSRVDEPSGLGPLLTDAANAVAAIQDSENQAATTAAGYDKQADSQLSTTKARLPARC